MQIRNTSAARKLILAACVQRRASHMWRAAGTSPWNGHLVWGKLRWRCNSRQQLPGQLPGSCHRRGLHPFLHG